MESVAYQMKPYLNETYPEMIQRLVGAGINQTLSRDSTKIIAGLGNDIVALDASNDTYRIAVGNSDYNLANFRVTKEGVLYAKGAEISGTIKAEIGNLGNWTINGTSIYTGTEDHSGYTTNAGDITLYSDGSNASIHAKNFYIDTSGNLTATSVTLTGVVASQAGSSYIGNVIATSYTAADITADQFTNSLATIDSSTDKGELGFDSSGNLITKAIPASNVAPSGAGLYLGADYMGYYNGSAWRTYMDNSGNFFLGGSSGTFQWNGGALTIDTSSGDAINIVSGAGINVAAGGDITLVGADAGWSKVQWVDSSLTDGWQVYTPASGASFFIKRVGTSAGTMSIGDTYTTSIEINAEGYYQMETLDSGGNYALHKQSAESAVNPYFQWNVNEGGTIRGIYFNLEAFNPITNNHTDLGVSATNQWKNLYLSGNITVGGTVDGVDVAALKSDVDGFPDSLKIFTAAEITQLTNINAYTFTNAQWGYLSDNDQYISTNSNVTHNSIYLEGDCSALTFTDRTPYPDKETAYNAILSMERKDDGLDHTKLHDFVLAKRTKMDGEENEVLELGRNLSATVSALVEVNKDLIARIERLEA